MIVVLFVVLIILCSIFRAVHQTMTIRTLLDDCDVRFQGQACTQDSWFPGYAWTIAYCGICRNHLGWKFTVARASDAQSFDDMTHDDNDDDDYENMESDTLLGEDDSTATASSHGDDEDVALEGTSNYGTEDMTQDENSDEGGATASQSSYFSVQDEVTASIASDDESYQSAHQQEQIVSTIVNVSTDANQVAAQTSSTTATSANQVLQFW